MVNEKVKVNLSPVIGENGKCETIGEIRLLNAIDADTGENLGMIAKLGLADTLFNDLDKHPELKDRFIECSNEISSIIAELFKM